MFKFGVDPELFVKKDNEFVCAWGMIEGDKENPKRVNKGAVQVDGFALEFNIDPVSTEEDFVLSINEVMEQLYAMVPGYEVVAVPTAPFSLEYIKSQPEEARELGCSPDYNAWEDGKPFPKPDGERPFRTGAGHLHIGWTEDEDVNNPEHIEKCIALVKQLDFFLGLPSVLLDKDDKRREMYGKAGCFRPKSYGVEYRTLSNFWIVSDEMIKYIYANTNLAINRLMEGEALTEDIQEVINKSDKEKALELIIKYNIPMEGI